MLFLLFELDGERYALDAREVAHVRPLEPVRPVPGTPPWIAGVIPHALAPVPVIDLAMRALGRPSRALMSTRLVLVRDRAAATGTTAANDDAAGVPARLVALMLECATRTRQIAAHAFEESGVATPEARWLGPVARDESGFVQWVKADQLLDDEVRARLFPDPPSWRGPGAAS